MFLIIFQYLLNIKLSGEMESEITKAYLLYVPPQQIHCYILLQRFTFNGYITDVAIRQ